MIVRFEGGPYHGLTVEVHGEYKDFRAMGLAPAAWFDDKRRHHSHELVAGQYVAQEKLEAQVRVFIWDGPEVEAPTLLLNVEPLVEQRACDADRRSGHSMGRRSFRGDRRQQHHSETGWRELRRLVQRRKPNPGSTTTGVV